MDIDEFSLELQSVSLALSNMFERYRLSCRKNGHPRYSIMITCGTQDLRDNTGCNDATNNCAGTIDGNSRIYLSPFVTLTLLNGRFTYGSVSESIGEVMCQCDLTVTEDMSITTTRQFNITGITDIYMHIFYRYMYYFCY